MRLGGLTCLFWAVSAKSACQWLGGAKASGARAVADSVVGVAVLPEAPARFVGEAAFDFLHRFGEMHGRDEDMRVVGYDDEGVEFAGAGAAVVL